MDAYVYVSHSAKCPQRANKFWRRCRCRKWIYLSGSRKRISAKTRSWEQAEKEAAKYRDPETRPVGKTVKDAVSDFLTDKREQNLSDDYIKKVSYDLETILLPWCEKNHITSLTELDAERLREFRQTWTGNANTRSRKQERVRTFFEFCKKYGWVRENPAKLLSRIKVERIPTDYFTDEEFRQILAAVGKYHEHTKPEIHQRTRRRARAFISLLRWSGLRIGDAATLERPRLGKDDRLFLYAAKTGEPVSVRLPEHLANELRNLPNSNAKYFFWSGSGTVKSTTDSWWRTLSRIFKHANLGKRAHPHMFRDTFAVNLLLSGATLDKVQMLLGHSSIKVTERHYSPWIKARQDMLDEAVQNSWAK